MTYFGGKWVFLRLIEVESIVLSQERQVVQGDYRLWTTNRTYLWRTRRCLLIVWEQRPLSISSPQRVHGILCVRIRPRFLMYNSDFVSFYTHHLPLLWKKPHKFILRLYNIFNMNLFVYFNSLIIWVPRISVLRVVRYILVYPFCDPVCSPSSVLIPLPNPMTEITLKVPFPFRPVPLIKFWPIRLIKTIRK